MIKFIFTVVYAFVLVVMAISAVGFISGLIKEPKLFFGIQDRS